MWFVEGKVIEMRYIRQFSIALQMQKRSSNWKLIAVHVKKEMLEIGFFVSVNAVESPLINFFLQNTANCVWER